MLSRLSLPDGPDTLCANWGRNARVAPLFRGRHRKLEFFLPTTGQKRWTWGTQYIFCSQLQKERGDKHSDQNYWKSCRTHKPKFDADFKERWTWILSTSSFSGDEFPVSQISPTKEKFAELWTNLQFELPGLIAIKYQKYILILFNLVNWTIVIISGDISLIQTFLISGQTSYLELLTFLAAVPFWLIFYSGSNNSSLSCWILLNPLIYQIRFSDCLQRRVVKYQQLGEQTRSDSYSSLAYKSQHKYDIWPSSVIAYHSFFSVSVRLFQPEF